MYPAVRRLARPAYTPSRIQILPTKARLSKHLGCGGFAVTNNYASVQACPHVKPDIVRKPTIHFKPGFVLGFTACLPVMETLASKQPLQQAMVAALTCSQCTALPSMQSFIRGLRSHDQPFPNRQTLFDNPSATIRRNQSTQPAETIDTSHHHNVGNQEVTSGWDGAGGEKNRAHKVRGQSIERRSTPAARD